MAQNILLVEDEAFVREVACEVLSAAGYQVLKAGNAAEAISVFHNHRESVQLLLTDVVLPDRNGCELAIELSKLCDGVKAIFISGYPENSVATQGLLRRDWGYLPKPFSAASLIQKVKEILHGASRDSIAL